MSEWEPVFSKWRHGGWYVDNVRYPSGAVGCVSNNFADGKWRIVCGPHDLTFSTRSDAAKAERILASVIKTETETESADGSQGKKTPETTSDGFSVRSDLDENNEECTCGHCPMCDYAMTGKDVSS